MLIIRGVNVYPSQIEAVLVGLPDVAPYYQLVVERKGAMDHLTVEVEIGPGLAGSANAYPVVAEQVRHHIKSMIGVSTEVVMKQPGEIPRSQGKAVRVRDLRPSPALSARSRQVTSRGSRRLRNPTLDSLSDWEGLKSTRVPQRRASVQAGRRPTGAASSPQWSRTGFLTRSLAR
jgi:acyl-CoA synthetase (AMP-forming)/AMP-acid ligase II